MSALTSKPATKEELEQCADQLEAAMAVMHGTAYQPSRKAVRCLRVLAKDPSITEEEGVVLPPVIAELNHYAETVNPVPRQRMLNAAALLSGFLPA